MRPYSQFLFYQTHGMVTVNLLPMIEPDPPSCNPSVHALGTWPLVSESDLAAVWVHSCWPGLPLSHSQQPQKPELRLPWVVYLFSTLRKEFSFSGLSPSLDYLHTCRFKYLLDILCSASGHETIISCVNRKWSTFQPYVQIIECQQYIWDVGTALHKFLLLIQKNFGS